MIGEQADAATTRAWQPADVKTSGPECPVCRAAQEAVGTLLEMQVDGGINWPAICNLHAWQLGGEPAVVRQVAEARVRAALERLDGPATGRLGRQASDASAAACPFCAAMTVAAQAAVGAAGATPARLLCLPHLCTALEQARGREDVRALVGAAITHFEVLEQELSDLIRKSDYRFRGEPRGSEATSWRRAAQLLAGVPGVHWALRREPEIEG